MHLVNKFAIGLVLILSLVITAADAAWDGGIEGGAVVRDDGNATKLSLKLFNDARPLNHSIYADWYRTENGENSYEVGYLPRYWFDSALYAFGEIRVRVDKPLAIDQETQAALGAGNRFISTDTRLLWAELGVGQRNTEFSNQLSSDETFALLRGGYRQTLTDFFRIETDLDFIRSDRATESIAEAGIVLNTGTGAVKFSYRTRRLSRDGQTTITDSESFVSFNYSI
ncbi:MAG: DUF481 domain-containing protein [Granulosicoccus sp.]|nr:DUF481 domain-containing protein [Granulosicoccus sp.]